MTHVPGLSVKVSKNSSQNERLWRALDIDNVSRPTFGLPLDVIYQGLMVFAKRSFTCQHVKKKKH